MPWKRARNKLCQKQRQTSGQHASIPNIPICSEGNKDCGKPLASHSSHASTRKGSCHQQQPKRAENFSRRLQTQRKHGEETSGWVAGCWVAQGSSSGNTPGFHPCHRDRGDQGAQPTNYLPILNAHARTGACTHSHTNPHIHK